MIPHFGFGLEFGAETIDTNNYNTIRFQPDFSIGKFGIGLDINFEFDANGNFRISEWNTWQAVISKILYIRYGQKGEPVYAKIGGINDFTLGNGFIVNRYSNMLNYPDIKKLGIAFDLDFTKFGFQTMVNNIFLFDILGIRLFYRPLNGMDFPIISNLEIGATVSADLDSQNPAPPSDKPYDFKYAGSGSNTIVYGVDLGLPVLNNPAITMRTYLDYASIIGKGSGEALGLGGKIVTIVPYQLEARLFQPKFVPNYFDLYYDSVRAVKYNSLDSISNSYAGWLFGSGLSLFEDKLYFLFKIENTFSTDTLPELTFTLGLSKDLLKRLGIQIVWTRKNIASIGDILSVDSVNSVLFVNMDYYVTDNLAVSINYKRSFEMDSSGQIQPYMSTSVSTKINF